MDGFAAENASEVRLLSVWRRTQSVYWSVVCDDGGDVAARHHRVALSIGTGAGPDD